MISNLATNATSGGIDNHPVLYNILMREPIKITKQARICLVVTIFKIRLFFMNMIYIGHHAIERLTYAQNTNYFIKLHFLQAHYLKKNIQPRHRLVDLQLLNL